MKRKPSTSETPSPTTSPAKTHTGLPEGWAIVEESLDGRLWFYPAWLLKQAHGYLAPVYFPPSDHDYRADRAEVRRFTRRDRAVAFVRQMARQEIAS